MKYLMEEANVLEALRYSAFCTYFISAVKRPSETSNGYCIKPGGCSREGIKVKQHAHCPYPLPSTTNSFNQCDCPCYKESSYYKLAADVLGRD